MPSRRACDIMRILYFDAFNGASGDMVLGALLDAGLPVAALRAALGSLGLADYAITTARVLRAGVSATKFRLEERAPVAALSGAICYREAERHGRWCEESALPELGTRQNNCCRRRLAGIARLQTHSE